MVNLAIYTFNAICTGILLTWMVGARAPMLAILYVAFTIVANILAAGITLAKEAK